MAGRRVNLALLWATVLALVTGMGAFLVGSPSGTWLVVGHGVVALAIIVLTPGKSAVVARGIQRTRPGRVLSVVLIFATVAALVTGVLLITGSVQSIGPFTTMQLHVSLGLLTVSLTLIHTLQRPTSHRRSDLSRRNAIRAGGVLAAACALWIALEGALDIVAARGGQRRFTGSHEIVDAAQVPVTQWLNDRVQRLDAGTHQVLVGDMAYSIADIVAPGDTIEATLDCTGGWYTTQQWAGARLDRLLPVSDAPSVVIRSTTGYWRRFPLEQAGSLLLATHMAGEPLRDGNGGPVRLVAPGRRGYWWVKWVESVEVDDLPPWWQPPLPTA